MSNRERKAKVEANNDPASFSEFPKGFLLSSSSGKATETRQKKRRDGQVTSIISPPCEGVPKMEDQEVHRCRPSSSRISAAGADVAAFAKEQNDAETAPLSAGYDEDLDSPEPGQEEVTRFIGKRKQQKPRQQQPVQTLDVPVGKNSVSPTLASLLFLGAEQEGNEPRKQCKGNEVDDRSSSSSCRSDMRQVDQLPAKARIVVLEDVDNDFDDYEEVELLQEPHASHVVPFAAAAAAAAAGVATAQLSPTHDDEKFRELRRKQREDLFKGWNLSYAQALSLLQQQQHQGRHQKKKADTTRGRKRDCNNIWFPNLALECVDLIMNANVNNTQRQHLSPSSSEGSNNDTNDGSVQKNLPKMLVRWTWQSILEGDDSHRHHQQARMRLGAGFLAHPLRRDTSWDELSHVFRRAAAAASEEGSDAAAAAVNRRRALQALYCLGCFVSALEREERQRRLRLQRHSQQQQNGIEQHGSKFPLAVPPFDGDGHWSYLRGRPLSALLDLLIPPSRRRNQRSPPKRTVLVQAAIDLIWQIVAASCEGSVHTRKFEEEKETDDNDRALRDELVARINNVNYYVKSANILLEKTTCSRLQQLLQVQLQWVREKILKAKNVSWKTSDVHNCCRLECQVAIMADWYCVLQQYQNGEEAGAVLEKNLVASFAGIPLNSEEGEELFGGIRQTILTNATSENDVDPTAELELVRSRLLSACASPATRNGATKNVQICDLESDSAVLVLRSLLRGTLAQLRQRFEKKNRSHLCCSEQRFVNLLRDCTTNSTLLSSTRTSECASFMASLQRILWYHGLSFAKFDSQVSFVTKKLWEDALDQSFRNLLAAIVSNNLEMPHAMKSILPHQAVEYIRLREDKELLIPLVSDNAIFHPSTVDILVGLCRIANSKASTGANDESSLRLWGILNETAQGEIRDAAAIHLLDNFHTNPLVQDAFRHDKNLLIECSLKQVVPKLIRILIDLEQEKSRSSCDSGGTVTRCLIGVWGSNAKLDDGASRGVIHEILNALNSNVPNEAGNFILNKVCSRVGREWSESLVLKEASSMDAVLSRRALVAIGDEMFANPSQMAPLILFGSVIDSYAGEVDRGNNIPITRLVKDLLELSLRNLTAESSKGQGDHGIASEFQRLSPLLLLRRIPRGFFRASWMDAAATKNGRTEERSLLISHLVSLSSVLAERMGIEVSTRNGKTIISSPEERRLSSEIAGRALPFDSLGDDLLQGCSCFHTICQPAFESLKKCLQQSLARNRETSDLVARIRSARAALYSVCHAVPFAEDSDDGLPLLKASSFVLEVLSATAKQSFSQEVADELSRLQAGCIEFSALSVQRLFESSGTARTFDGPCNDIQQLSSLFKAMGDCNNSTSVPFLDTTRFLYERMKSIAATGKALRHNVGHGTVDTVFSDKHVYPVEARICLWNALILVAQRCDPTILESFGMSTLKWAVPSGACAGIDHSVHHPLCVAAAMKLTLAIATRLTKCSSSGLADLQASGLLDTVHNWAVETIRTDYTTKNGAHCSHAVRLEALKLLLLFVSAGANQDGQTSTLSSKQISDALSLVARIAENDTDQELQQFARKVVSMLRS